MLKVKMTIWHLHLVIRRLEEAPDTLENDPAYNSDFVDDDEDIK